MRDDIGLTFCCNIVAPMAIVFGGYTGNGRYLNDVYVLRNLQQTNEEYNEIQQERKDIIEFASTTDEVESEEQRDNIIGLLTSELPTFSSTYPLPWYTIMNVSIPVYS